MPDRRVVGKVVDLIRRARSDLVGRIQAVLWHFTRISGSFRGDLMAQFARFVP
jgi:hypothetical protein